MPGAAHVAELGRFASAARRERAEGAGEGGGLRLRRLGLCQAGRGALDSIPCESLSKSMLYLVMYARMCHNA